MLEYRAKILALLAILLCMTRADVPSSPSTDPYYPYDVPQGNYPSYWPRLGGANFTYQRSNAPYYPNWPGLGYMAWAGFVAKEMGSPGGNIWALKWGQLPADYSYESSRPVTVSYLDTVRVYLQSNYKIFRMASKSDYDSCNFDKAVEAANVKSASLPVLLEHAFVQQSAYPCKNASQGVLNPWKCTTISSPASEIDLHPLNPSGNYTADFPMAVDITFSSSDKGQTLYFADKGKCGAGVKIQVSVLEGMIVFLPWTEHVERFEKDGYLQNAYDKGLTISSKDQVWFITATYEHNVYRVARKEMWQGECPALGKLKVDASEAVWMDTSSSRMVYYPSNRPNARHVWVMKGSILQPGEEAYLGCFNVYHECNWFKNSTYYKPPCEVTHCNMGPAGGQRILIRRASNDINVPNFAVSTLPNLLMAMSAVLGLLSFLALGKA